MHMPGLIPLLIVLVLAFLLFSRPGRIAGIMKDFGEGIKGFRKGLSDDQNTPQDTPPPQVRDQAGERQKDNAQN